MFELIEKGDLKYYKSSLFENTGAVKHGFSTRLGGVSEGCYYSLNLHSYSGDDWNKVLENFKIISGALGMMRDRLVLSQQTHEDKIIDVDETHCGNGILYENKFASADALITNKKNVPIAVFSADCVTVLFLDNKNGVIAAAHSGWRGTVMRIAQKTAERMISKYGSKPEDILVAIGPSIQEDCFEVGDDVAEIFIDEFGDDTAKKYGERYHVNMQTAIINQLAQVGIGRENIDNSGICTACNPDLLYSHRKMGNARGNLGAFLELV